MSPAVTFLFSYFLYPNTLPEQGDCPPLHCQLLDLLQASFESPSVLPIQPLEALFENCSSPRTLSDIQLSVLPALHPHADVFTSRQAYSGPSRSTDVTLAPIPHSRCLPGIFTGAPHYHLQFNVPKWTSAASQNQLFPLTSLFFTYPFSKCSSVFLTPPSDHVSPLRPAATLGQVHFTVHLGDHGNAGLSLLTSCLVSPPNFSTRQHQIISKMQWIWSTHCFKAFCPDGVQGMCTVSNILPQILITKGKTGTTYVVGQWTTWPTGQG